MEIGRKNFTGYQKEKEIEEIMIIATAGGKKKERTVAKSIIGRRCSPDPYRESCLHKLYGMRNKTYTNVNLRIKTEIQ